MHLLRTEPGGFVDDADGIARVEQTPGEIVILSAADTELALLSAAANGLDSGGELQHSLRLCNLMHLRQHASVDLYIDDVLQHAKLVLVSLLGGESYWPYGVEQLVANARRRGSQLVLFSGDDQFDAELARQSTLPLAQVDLLWRYLRAGAQGNALNLLRQLGGLLGADSDQIPLPTALPRVAIWHPQRDPGSVEHWAEQWREGAPVAALIFYRAHLQSGNTAVFGRLCEGLLAQGVNPLPVAVASLKETLCRETFEALCAEQGVGLILNTTAFALSSVGGDNQQRPLAPDVPVLQVILCSANRSAWAASSLGLQPRDLAMHVALPEVDGRIISRAVSFKGLARRCELTETDVVHYEADPERCDFVAELAARWLRIARKPANQRHLALIMANYPSREGRLGNGVGLDTPASMIELLQGLDRAGYPVADLPDDGDALMARVQQGITNDPVARALRPMDIGVPLADYQRWYAALIPAELRQQVEQRWGLPEDEPSLREGQIPLAGFLLGETFIGVQPARGYHLDHSASYHDPDLVPPHSYLAFYLWLREHYAADALIHVGKHGNLEWLPGKGVGLSNQCWPDAILGPLPHLYPFIVNDPGEGSQAKRRAQAVIIDHLIPPLTRAESWGPMAELERLVDEFYAALQMDPRRAKLLRVEILELARSTHLDAEIAAEDDDELIGGMDSYLCELKEAQIRDGLHIFGRCPEGRLQRDTLAALLRLPRGDGEGENASLLRALAADFGLVDFDPLDCQLGEPWPGPRPDWLATLDSASWRTNGDTRERLELAALELLDQPELLREFALPASARVINGTGQRLATLLQQSADDEIGNLLKALEGRFVPAGPSGAPSRGRLDVLPTGRNFYSVDVRAVPTATAWRLGWKSANALIERHLQEQGDYPQQIGLSVWGTATMRTGGDDIAQAFALMGVRPVWDAASHRVTDFEVMPIELLDRPRIDVTLRVSGFFRDAFMNVIQLFDAAVQRVAELDESAEWNPIAQRIRAEQQRLEAEGQAADAARRQAGHRIFGSKPGSYGAGLQGLIDEGCWDERADLAEAYVNWGGYAYGASDEGSEAREALRQRLGQIDVVVQNQDNREHDLLDSDDYYQFQGGMSAAVATLSGREAEVYHMDHSQPETPKARTLKEEINRVVRSRVLNPKWLAGARRHGYKGAFEMAATVDYLFAYDATARVVDDYQYEAVTSAYIEDDENREFMQQHNPAALRESAERLLEAAQRGLWAEPPPQQLETLRELMLDLEQDWEEGL